MKICSHCGGDDWLCQQNGCWAKPENRSVHEWPSKADKKEIAERSRGPFLLKYKLYIFALMAFIVGLVGLLAWGAR